MRLALTPHPASISRFVSTIEVEVERSGGDLSLLYIVSGSVADLALPATSQSARTDGLWHHSCLEAFLRPAADQAYYEFNFSPSTEWAAYRFDSYRDGMTPAMDVPAPEVEAQSDSGRFSLCASLDLKQTSLAEGPWSLALSAVIEDKDGTRSYWALSHPPGKADFHHPESFVIQLPAGEQL